MSKLASRSAFDGVIVPGRYGNTDGAAGVVVSERKDLGRGSIGVSKGQEAALNLPFRPPTDSIFQTARP